MRQATCEQTAASTPGQPSDWVIDHMVALSEFARRRGLPGFEEKLLEATETLLEELHAKLALSCPATAPADATEGKVVLFADATRPASGQRAQRQRA